MSVPEKKSPGEALKFWTSVVIIPAIALSFANDAYKDRHTWKGPSGTMLCELRGTVNTGPIRDSSDIDVFLQCETQRLDLRMFGYDRVEFADTPKVLSTDNVVSCSFSESSKASWFGLAKPIRERRYLCKKI